MPEVLLEAVRAAFPQQGLTPLLTRIDELIENPSAVWLIDFYLQKYLDSFSQDDPMPSNHQFTAGDVIQITFPSGEVTVAPVVYEGGEMCILHQGDVCRLLMHEGKVYKIAEWPFGIHKLKPAVCW